MRSLFSRKSRGALAPESPRAFFSRTPRKREMKSVLTLADCEWRAAAAGLKPLRLTRAQEMNKLCPEDAQGISLRCRWRRCQPWCQVFPLGSSGVCVRVCRAVLSCLVLSKPNNQYLLSSLSLPISVIIFACLCLCLFVSVSLSQGWWCEF